MAFVLSDRIKETTTTTSTGTYTLGGAVSGFETFTANLSNGDTTYYCCTDGTDFEVGLGTFASSGTTLARTTIISSSNSNNAVNWSSGSRDIFCTLPGSKVLALNGSGNILLENGAFIFDRGSSTDPTIHLTGIGPNTIRFHDGQDETNTSNAVDIAYRTSPNDLRIERSATGNVMAEFGGDDGHAALYHDNSKKLETTSGGVTITGALTGNVTGDLTGNADTASAVAADNLSAGDSAVNLRTTSGNITIDAQASNSDIIFKGTDGGVDTTFLTLDGSSAGTATFNNKVVAGGGIESSSYFWQKNDNNVSLYSGANFEILLQHVHNTGLKLINNGTGTPAVELQFVDSNEAIGSDGTNLKLTSGGNEITVPNSGADTMTLNAATQTLTNKTLTSPKINEDVAVTATATEINKLDGVTATTTELNYVDVTTLGTVEASKAVVVDSDKDISGFRVLTTQKNYVTATDDVSASSTAHPFQIGSTSSNNIAMDGNEIMARNNGSISTLKINDGALEVGSSGATVTGDLQILSTDANAEEDPSLILYRNSSSPADSDEIGEVVFRGRNDNSQDVDYANIIAQITDASDGSEDGRIKFFSKVGGNNLNHFQIGFGTTDIFGRIRLTGSTIFSNPVIIFEGSTANSNETTLAVTDPSQDNTVTLPDATGTVLTTGNSDTPTTTTSSSDADFVLVDDGGTMKKITPSNLGITSGGASKGFAVAMAIAL